MVLAVGFLMIILSCVLYQNWLPLLVGVFSQHFVSHGFEFSSALIFVLAPLPNALFSHCGSDEFAGSYDGASSGPVDLGRFITAMVVTSGFALPIVLAHAQVIRNAACIMSILGGGCVRFSAAVFAHSFASFPVWFMAQSWPTRLLSDRKSQNSTEKTVLTPTENNMDYINIMITVLGYAGVVLQREVASRSGGTISLRTRGRVRQSRKPPGSDRGGFREP
jgi:hypothetical protein